MASGVPQFRGKKPSAGIAVLGTVVLNTLFFVLCPVSSQSFSRVSQPVTWALGHLVNSGRNPDTEGIIGFLKSFFFQKAKWYSNMSLDILGSNAQEFPQICYSQTSKQVSFCFCPSRILNCSLLSLHIPLSSCLHLSSLPCSLGLNFSP